MTYVAGSLATSAVNADMVVSDDSVNGIAIADGHGGDIDLTEDVRDAANT